MCPRYMGVALEHVQVAPSPAWLRERLEAVDVRSINNVVDLTNYVMLELGQPMHAFDVSNIHGGAIIVRRANKGETIETLDGVMRTLNDSMLVIADKDRAVALAGIMGGEESGGMGIKGNIPERDGILAGLHLLELMAYEKKTFKQILDKVK